MVLCVVCEGSGRLLGDVCPLCDGVPPVEDGSVGTPQPCGVHTSSSKLNLTEMDRWFAENLKSMKLDDGSANNFPKEIELSFEPFDHAVGEAVPFLRANPCDDAVENFVYFCAHPREYGDYATIGGTWFFVDFTISHEVKASNYMFVIGICTETRRLTVEVKEAYNRCRSDGTHMHNYSDVLEKALQYCVTAFVWFRQGQELDGENEKPGLFSKADTFQWIQANVDSIKSLHWHLDETEAIKQTVFVNRNDSQMSNSASNRVFLEAMPGNPSGQFHYVVPQAVTNALLQEKQPNFKCEDSVWRFAFEGELGTNFTRRKNIVLGYRDVPDHEWALSVAVVYKKT